MQDAYTTTSENPLISLSHTLQTLRDQESIEALVRTTLDYLQREFNYALLWVGVYDRLTHRLQGVAGQLGEGQANLPQQFALSPGDIMEQTVIQQSPVQVADLREESRGGQWQTLASRYGIQGTTVFPLCHRHLCFGVVMLGSSLWGDFPSTEERSVLSMLFGELAMGFHQADLAQQRQRLKRPHEPLLEMMSQLQDSQSLDARLITIVATTQQFLMPARTHIYWYDGERGLFWLRSREQGSSSRRHRPTGGSTSRNGSRYQETEEIPLAEFSGFHKTLCENRLVAIGEAYSSLKADATSRLMAQIGARSLLAAPILSKGQLLGFLSVEG
ncbi:MAG: GAF domain-containing protein, partial [Phormidium sp. GEM2.Bin31]